MATADETIGVVTFALGEEEYGVGIEHVQEINRMAEVTRVPGAPPGLEGVINLRGALVPILDLRARLGLPRVERGGRTRIVVTEVGATRIGMVVDCVREVLRIPRSQIEAPPPMLAANDANCIGGVGKVGDRLIILLDAARIVERSDLQ